MALAMAAGKAGGLARRHGKDVIARGGNRAPGERFLSLGWLFGPVGDDASRDDRANFAQGVEKDRGRDFRSKANVDAKFESARDPIERVALRREPEDFSRVALADSLEERNGLVLVKRHYFPFR